MRTTLLLAGALAAVLSRATPVGTRAAVANADLEPGVPPFFASLLQAYALRDEDETALIAEVEDALRDEKAGIEAFFVDFRAPGADPDPAAAATAIQRRGAASHALFDAAVESAVEQWARAAGTKNDDDDNNNRALINRCLREVETDKVKARETTKTETKDEEEGAASIVVEGLPRSCGELMEQWRGLEGHAADVRVVGSDALEFSL